MKKWIVLAVIGLIATQAYPQNPHHQNRDNHLADRGLMKDLEPEQRAVLKAKKMTLDLDLNQKQQEQVQELLVDREVARAAKKSKKDLKDLTNEQRFELMEARLDEQIDFQQALKGILTEAQWDRFKAHQQGRKRHRKQDRHQLKK